MAEMVCRSHNLWTHS